MSSPAFRAPRGAKDPTWDHGSSVVEEARPVAGRAGARTTLGSELRVQPQFVTGLNPYSTAPSSASGLDGFTADFSV